MLKAYVTDLESVDENLRGLYAEKDGKFFLQVTGVDGWELDNVAGLKSALGTERKTAGDLRVRLDAFGDLDPSKARKAMKDAARFAEFDPEVEADKLAKERFDAQRAQLMGQHNEALAGLQGTIERRNAQVQNLLVGTGIKGALQGTNPDPDLQDALEMILAKSIRTKEVGGDFVIEVVDDSGNPRIKDGFGNAMTIQDLVKEVREKRPAFFKADEVHGIPVSPKAGPTARSGVSNPWAKDSWNFTEQMKLENTNPTLANQLKAQAGAK